jgi:hypothetical protein
MSKRKQFDQEPPPLVEKRRQVADCAAENGSLCVKKLDPHTLRDSRMVCFVAQKGGGMSTVVRDFLFRRSDVPPF